MAIPQYNQNKAGDKLEVQINDRGGIQIVGAGYLAGQRHLNDMTADYENANPYAESSTQLFPLGSWLSWGDRVFRYGSVDGATTAGMCVQEPANIANHKNGTITNEDAPATGAFSHAAGSYKISMDTAGDTDLTADQYAGGYLSINDVTGEGQWLRIKSHPAHDHGADPSVVITCYDPLTTTIVKNSSQASLHADPYKGAVIAPVAETGAVVGVTNLDMTDAYFGWFQVRGPRCVLAASALVIGHQAVRNDTTTAGAVMANNGDDLVQHIGTVMAGVVVDSEYCPIWLNIC